MSVKLFSVWLSPLEVEMGLGGIVYSWTSPDKSTSQILCL